MSIKEPTADEVREELEKLDAKRKRLRAYLKVLELEEDAEDAG